MYAEYFINGLPALSSKEPLSNIDEIPSVGQIISPFNQLYIYKVKSTVKTIKKNNLNQLIEVVQIDLEPVCESAKKVFEMMKASRKK